MYRFLSSPIDKSKSKKIYCIVLTLFCAIPVLLNTLVLVPIYASLEANVAYRSSVITIIIKYSQDLLDLCAFSVSYALIIFSMLLLSKTETRLTVIFYTILFVAQIPLKILMNAVVYGSIGNSADILLDVAYLAIYFLLQMLQLLIVYVFTKIDSSKYKLYVDSLDDPKQISRPEPQKILPLKKFVNWNNPLQRSAIKMSILILTIKLLTRIANDITYGAPGSFAEVLIMCVYYISDVLYGVIAYVMAVVTITAVYERLKKRDRKNSLPPQNSGE